MSGESVQGLLRQGAQQLKQAGIDTPVLDAELLLGEVLGLDRLRLRLESRGDVPGNAIERYQALLQRRVLREPVAYILGRKEFWGLDFEVGPGVLVPRPETEHLVEAALQRWKGRSPDLMLDICCGAAPLAVALSLELRPRRAVALDLSAEALRYAVRNVRRHGLTERIHLVRGDLLESISPALFGQVDLIVCNPPYIPSRDVLETMPEVSRYEPHLALDGGTSGLLQTERVLRGAYHLLKDGGGLALETGDGLMAGLLQLARDCGFAKGIVLRDLAGRERGLWVEKEGP